MDLPIRSGNPIKRDTFYCSRLFIVDDFESCRYLLKVVLLALIFPALSSLRGFSPHHDTRWAASSNHDIFVPTSAIIEVAERP